MFWGPLTSEKENFESGVLGHKNFITTGIVKRQKVFMNPHCNVENFKAFWSAPLLTAL